MWRGGAQLSQGDANLSSEESERDYNLMLRLRDICVYKYKCYRGKRMLFEGK